MASDVSKENILEEFKLLNITPDDKVISKCMEMCLIHNVGPEDLIDGWLAYSASVLKGAAPTVEHLEKFERKEFLKSKDQGVRKVASKDHSPYVPPTHQSSVSNADVLGTPKGNHAPLSKIQTPVQARRLAGQPMEISMSSPGDQSGTYSKRTNARSVSCFYGTTNATFKNKSQAEVFVTPLYETGLTADTKYMFEVLGTRGMALNNMTEEIIEAIGKKYNLRTFVEQDTEADDSEVDNTLFYGRIVSDSDGKINSQSVLLEQTARNQGIALSLNLSKMPKYSLFPGQVVAVRGALQIVRHHQFDQTKNKLNVENMYYDTAFNLPLAPPIIQDPLQVVVACGPFTVQDNLSFEPLDDLLKYVQENKPNVLMLLGPFYEKNNEGISNRNFMQTFDSLFLSLLDNIHDALINTGTKIIMVASSRDPHHHPVYPTPPYTTKDRYSNITFMPDPCMINVNGLVIGATTADILFHISNFEIFYDRITNSPQDRMARMARHLIEQQSFYPLDPPHKDVGIDMSLMEYYGVMHDKPHILVLPSNLRHFVKEIDDCLVINPERLTKGYGGGTFARIEINPGNTRSICGRTACQVLRI